MKKGIVAVATIIALLMCFSLSGFAAQTKEPPAVMNGVVAYSFEDVEEATFTNEGGSTYFSGNEAATEDYTDASLVDLDGGKAAKIDFLEEVNGMWLHSNCFRPGSWPEAGEPVKGWFFRVQCTGGEAWLAGFRIRLNAKPGTFNDNTETVPVDVTPGTGTQNTVRVFDMEGNEIWEMVDFRNGYDALVMLDDGFDGYIVIDYSETVYIDSNNQNVLPGGLEWPDYATVEGNASHMNLEWVEEGTSLTFTDYGYLTASPSAGEAPVEPSDDLAETPSEAPTETAEASPSPVVSPSAASSPSASPEATESTEEPDSNIWLYVGIGAAVVIIAAVVIFIFVKKGKKKEA